MKIEETNQAIENFKAFVTPANCRAKCYECGASFVFDVEFDELQCDCGSNNVYLQPSNTQG